MHCANIKFLIIATLFGLHTSVFCQKINPSKDSTLKILKFKYKYPGSGLGPGPNIRIIEANSENKVASKILLDVLQSYNFSVLNLKKGTTVLEQKRQYLTDTSLLNKEIIQKHNQENRQMQLPIRHYGIKLIFFYSIDINNQEIAFSIQSVLLQRGGAGPWSQYKGPYSGIFFTNLIVNSVKNKMDQLYPTKKL